MGGDASGNGNSVIESNGGNIVIEGGFFYTDYAYRNFYYVLNQQNGNSGTVTVKGGAEQEIADAILDIFKTEKL